MLFFTVVFFISYFLNYDFILSLYKNAWCTSSASFLLHHRMFTSSADLFGTRIVGCRGNVVIGHTTND